MAYTKIAVANNRELIKLFDFISNSISKGIKQWITWMFYDKKHSCRHINDSKTFGKISFTHENKKKIALDNILVPKLVFYLILTIFFQPNLTIYFAYSFKRPRVSSSVRSSFLIQAGSTSSLIKQKTQRFIMLEMNSFSVIAAVNVVDPSRPKSSPFGIDISDVTSIRIQFL